MYAAVTRDEGNPDGIGTDGRFPTASAEDAMKTRRPILMSSILLALLWLALLSCTESGSNGTIRGFVLVPKEIDLATAPNEAKLYIYLVDYTPKEGKQVPPWEAPTKGVKASQINTLKNHKVSFEFGGLGKGKYGVSVLVDTGRPHVPEGSLNFTAFPGDYAGGTQEELDVEDGQAVEVSISEGLYVTVPEGYQAPLYSPE